MKFGDYECFPLDLGDFRDDGGAMFGIIPKVQWEKKITADENNRILLKSRVLLIQGNGKNILVDTGYGNKLSKKMKSQYGIEKGPLNIKLVLGKYGLDTTQITDVILTHLHFDHTGGATTKVGDDILPTFPNAKYHIQSEQWEIGNSPHERSRDSYLADDFLPLKDNNVLQLVDGAFEIFPGIEIMVTYGHAAGQQHIVVRGEDQSLFFCGDLVPTAAHIPVPWHMGYDNKPLDLYPEKDYFLRKALRENWVLFFAHDPKIEAATVKQGEKWVEFDQELKL
ncbi:MBL fold metallo-hydrolase [bacterium]|nr:MBL fold metallo-hydrolase [bacterium]